MVLITIDGNIGAGKSTILKFLKDVANINADLEPVDEWEPFLVDMYKNNKDVLKDLPNIVNNIDDINDDNVYRYFDITEEEIEFIETC